MTGLRDTLVNHTRNLSLVTGPAAAGAGAEASSSTAAAGATETTTTTAEGAASAEDEATVLAKIKGEAAKRLRDLQRAEDAADEALIKFGTGLRDFLREAITIAPPTGGASASGSGSNVTGSTVLFESKDAQGKRVIHTSRFDAQLHVIHTSPDSFAKDPSGGDEFVTFAKSFDIDSKTTDIASDLNKYPELRTTMEKLVPDTVPYADFWKRYYFLRHGIETAEARRRDLLKGELGHDDCVFFFSFFAFYIDYSANTHIAASAEEDIAWDEDSDDEAEDESDADTESEETKAAGKAPAKQTGSTESSKTLHPPKSTKSTKKTAAKKVASTTSVDGLLKPGASPRKSDEKSVADSEASYDIVGAKSGAPSQAPNSPQRVEEDSEEEDWE